MCKKPLSVLELIEILQALSDEQKNYTICYTFDSDLYGFIHDIAKIANNQEKDEELRGQTGDGPVVVLQGW